MRVKDLIDLLQKQDPNWTVILHTEDGYPLFDVAENLTPGVFSITDYGNDFLPFEFKKVYPYDKMAVLIATKAAPVSPITEKMV